MKKLLCLLVLFSYASQTTTENKLYPERGNIRHLKTLSIKERVAVDHSEMNALKHYQEISSSRTYFYSFMTLLGASAFAVTCLTFPSYQQPSHPLFALTATGLFAHEAWTNKKAHALYNIIIPKTVIKK